MQKKLWENEKKGDPKLGLLALLMPVVFIGGFIGGAFLGGFIFFIIEELIGREIYANYDILMGLFGLCGAVGLTVLLQYVLFGKKAKINIGRKINWDKAVKKEKIPHFGKMLGYTKTKDFLQKESFRLYTFKNGEEACYMRASESGRWLSFLGGYLPVDFICGFNKEKAELYTIDGFIIRLSASETSRIVATEIDMFLRERGSYYKEMPEDAWRTFSSMYSLYQGRGFSLAQDDWGEIRYKWEKRLIKESKRYSSGIVSNYEAIHQDGRICTDIFERVLSDHEIKLTMKAIRNRRIDLKRYMCFSDYKNEYSVCNGIDLLRQLKSPYNHEGCDFLFECLGNIDEPYFFMAVKLLKSFPKNMLKEKIEEYAGIAHESGDVEKFGGLLYLAKELKYDIKYVEKMKAEEEARKDKRVEEAKEVARGQVMQMFR